MKKIPLITLVLILLSSISIYGWVTAITRSTMTIRMTDAAPTVQVSSTKTGTYSNQVAADNTFTLSPSTSTDGITFYDEDGNSSSQYAQLLFYVKSSSFYDSLYVDAVTITPATSGIKVAVEYDGVCTLLSSGRTKLNKPVDSTPKAVKVRVWIDGATVTSQITGDINIALDFSANII